MGFSPAHVRPVGNRERPSPRRGKHVFWVALIIMVVAVAVILGSGLADRPSKAVAGGMVLLFISVAFMVIASITTVPTRSIGITTQFGRPYGHPLSNGAHMVRPWASVEKCDGTVQTLALTDARDRGTDDQDATHDDGPPMAVRIGNQT